MKRIQRQKAARGGGAESCVKGSREGEMDARGGGQRKRSAFESRENKREKSGSNKRVKSAVMRRLGLLTSGANSANMRC